jgi:cyclic beta-1,2-glucan synthetase
VSAAAQTLPTGPLETAARDLAGRQRPVRGGRAAIGNLRALQRVPDWLAGMRESLEQTEGARSKAAEWVLDNAHVVAGAVRQLFQDLPRSFQRQLPTTHDADGRSAVRIRLLAAELCSLSPHGLSAAVLHRFLGAYQGVEPLALAELWALPSLLRVATLERFVRAAARIFPEHAAPLGPDPGAAGPPEAETETLATAIRDLRTLAAISWRELVTEQSVLEAELRREPTGVYRQMDFETCDRYRRAVEALARRVARPEPAVAREAVALTREFLDRDPRRSHVGYWLIDEGVPRLERTLGARPSWLERMRRALRARATALYLSTLAAATLGALALPAAFAVASGAGAPMTALVLLLAALPASAIGVGVVHFAIGRLLTPRVLPKLDFEGGIPERWPTAIVVPTLIGSEADARRLAAMLERHYLGNPDPGLAFVLLTDLLDAATREAPGDAAALEATRAAIRALNERYGRPGRGPFHLLHRERRWNPTENCWMGWERKRGKLAELGRWLRGEPDTSFVLHEGEEAALRGRRFVITLDADTRLPRGAAARLVGTLAHPLNRPEFDAASGAIRAGYAVVQPRIAISPDSGQRSPFAALYGGDTSIDIYSRAVSDAYQDLFGIGIYVGKGIYDVEAFTRSLEGRVPENRLASHDLFEGLHARTALASDITLYEDYPETYLAFWRRQHRWIRGDWQLCPWLRGRVPGEAGAHLESRFGALARWMILDNLRRSLLAVGTLALLLAGWLALPGSPAVWTSFALLAPAVPWLLGLAGVLAALPRRRLQRTLREARRVLDPELGRWLLLLMFLPHEAHVALDAVARTVYRLAWSRRRLLQWTAAAQASAALAVSGLRARTWSEMRSAPLTAIAAAGALALCQPHSLPVAGALLLAWLLAPELAHRLGRPRVERPRESLSTAQELWLRALARRTWLFFERFVGPEDHWLPPDNYQEQPGGTVAHRTSPTNVGMLLVSTVGAWDLGYIGRNALRARLVGTLDSIDRLEHYRGHLLNWYDTRALAPLEPRFVSTVDSGNLAAALLVTAEGCRDASSTRGIRPERWQGLRDVVGLLREALARAEPRLGRADRAELSQAVDTLERRLEGALEEPDQGPNTVLELSERTIPELDRRLVHALSETRGAVGLSDLREIRTWLARLHEQVRDLRRDLGTFSPWWEMFVAGAPPALASSGLASELATLLSSELPFDAIPERAALARERLERLRDAAQEVGVEAREWLDELERRLREGAERTAALVEDLARAAGRAEAEALGMDFRLVYDTERDLLRIGHNVSADRPDSHHYDLLASEARIASLFAIAKGDVPARHWFQLGRPVTRIAGRTLLLSWGGTMFEYLMPALFARSHPGTLLAESERGAIAAQMRDARRRGIPFGVSESGYAAFDAGHNYQYRAFGVADLGLRRGLERDCVIAPYASALALPLHPRAALENLRRLEDLGLLSTFGFYEALDYGSSGAGQRREPQIVRSHMAHHQGMALSALVNLLAGGVLIERFHRHPRLCAADLLLHERVPSEAPLEPRARREAPASRAPAAIMLPSWVPSPEARSPQAHLLGNGRLRALVCESGAGALFFHDCAVTRWAADSTLEPNGIWLYLRDEEDGELWSATQRPCASPATDRQTTFHDHAVEFHCREHGISTHLEIAVAPSEDVELRRVTVVNETDRTRRLVLTSYAEIALASVADFERHPAFSKLFVEAEHPPEVSGLLLARRPRGPGATAAVMLQRLVSEDPRVRLAGCETSRARFLGRLGELRAPQGALREAPTNLDLDFDPVASLRIELELPPYGRSSLALVTVLGASRGAVLSGAQRYETIAAVDWGFAEAAAESRREATRLRLDPELLPAYQQLFARLAFPRSESGVRAGELPLGGQPRLWGLGISGDHPIALLRVARPELGARVREVLRAHAKWRGRGEPIDLVVLLGFQSSYVDAFGEELRAALRELGAERWLGHAGGVHLVRADQVRREDVRMLEACARAVLEAEGGSIAEQLRRPAAPSVPPFAPALPAAPRAPLAPLERPSGLQLDSGFGGFSPDGHEYVIYLRPRERTPAPWSNVIASDGFGTLLTEAGLGFTWRENSAEHRITPVGNDPVCDPCGEAIYLRDEDTGELWTPTPAPRGGEAHFEIRHGAGYTQWKRRDHGLEQRLRVFVAADDPVKVARLWLTNPGAEPRRITATYFAEWVLGVRRGVSPLLETGYDVELGALWATDAWNPERADRVAFLASAGVPHCFTADRSEFLGAGGRAAPAALGRFGLSGRANGAQDACAALQVHLDLAPGATVEAYWLLGEANDRGSLRVLLATWREAGRLDREERAIAERWDARLGAVEVRTPDPALDLLINRWLPYQVFGARLLGRTGFYQPSGAFGFRDQLQDVLAVLHADPGFVREHLLRCAARQFEEGDVLHWWHPPGARGVRTRCSDDLLWLPYTVAEYVERTGDHDVLEERVPFLSAPPLSAEERDRYALFTQGTTSSSLFEHCVRALERAATTGPHGLPLIQDGDWNDGMNRIGTLGRGESVWLAWFEADTLQRFSRLCEARAEPELARFYRERARDLCGAAERHAWDGAWYLRAFADDGQRIGSSNSTDCRIDSIAQSWAELSGLADPERAARALESAFELLVAGDPPLVRLLTPPFTGAELDPGYIRAYPPGVRENGGHYAHAAAWLGLAFARRGDGDRAHAIFRALSPCHRAASRAAAERYRLEPYALAGDICSEPPHEGRGGWSQYTGAAGWTWRLAVEGLLGLELRPDGLRVRPALPSGWPGFQARIRTPSGVVELEVEAHPDAPRRAEVGVALPTSGETRRVQLQVGRQERAQPRPLRAGVRSG